MRPTRDMLTRAPLGFLLRVFTVDCRHTETPAMTCVVIRRSYAHLEGGLLRALRELGRMTVLVDRRHGERRRISETVASERRCVDRRQQKIEVVEILVPNELP